MATDSTNAKRQREYQDRQREIGRKLKQYWLTDEEARQVLAFIKALRESEGSTV